MTDDTRSKSAPAGQGSLPVLLLAAVVQGWGLYFLHRALQGQYWPATHAGSTLGLYAIAVFVPLTLQLLCAYVRERAVWVMTLVLAVSFFYFGWHHGVNVMDRSTERFLNSGDWFPMVLVLGVLWLMILPFLQARLANGRWQAPYELLFSSAWRNKLTLAEAALFTGLFWLLLMLWQQLFAMLGIKFFRELFEEPIFIYPVTAVVFGLALHLIGAIDRVSRLALEQILNVLKWLAILAGLLLTLFTIALIFKLPGMIESGERAISAAWLLWLVAVTVLLVNAAFRDGTVEQPYPQWIGFALRCVMPLVVVIALTALYAMYVRIDRYGLTVERVWACIVAAAAAIYAVGYAIAARHGERWMAGIPRVNVITALFLIAAISLALTPVLSPYRLAASSQYQMALNMQTLDDSGNRQTPLHALRFDLGKYGEARLRELTAVQGIANADRLRELSQAMLERKERWMPLPSNIPELLSALPIHPAGAKPDEDLVVALTTDEKSGALRGLYADQKLQAAGIFIDLNQDQVEEFVLITRYSGLVYQRLSEQWKRTGSFTLDGLPKTTDRAQLLAQEISAVSPRWLDLKVGRHVWQVNPE